MLNLQEIQDYEYRVAIHKAVPNVKILDDEPFLVEKVGGESVLREPPASLRVSKVPEHLKADWRLINEGIKSILLEEDEDAGAGLWICRGSILFFFFFLLLLLLFFFFFFFHATCLKLLLAKHHSKTIYYMQNPFCIIILFTIKIL